MCCPFTETKWALQECFTGFFFSTFLIKRLKDLFGIWKKTERISMILVISWIKLEVCRVIYIRTGCQVKAFRAKMVWCFPSSSFKNFLSSLLQRTLYFSIASCIQQGTRKHKHFCLIMFCFYYLCHLDVYNLSNCSPSGEKQISVGKGSLKGSSNIKKPIIYIYHRQLKDRLYL